MRSKEPPAAREQGSRAQCKNPEGQAWNWVTILICLCPHLSRAGQSPARNGTRGVRELYVEYNRPTNRPRALQRGRQCRRHQSKEREECATGEPERAWILLEIVGGSRSGEREPLRFLSDFIKMTVEVRVFARMSEDLGTTIWRLRETVRVAKLAATDRLGQMSSLLMHEKHKVWKREFGFDRIETAAEMDEKRSRTSTSPVPNPFFYRNMVFPSHPHTPDVFTLQMKVDVEGLWMEIILSQPPSSERDPSPRRAAVDTGSEEPGTPPQSPAISTGPPGASRAET